MIHEHDHHRMDDDGAPPFDNRHVLRIGIAPQAPPETPKLILPGQEEAPATKPA